MANEDLPKVLVLRPPSCFALLESLSCHKFQYVKAWDYSDLPLNHFLTSHGGDVRTLVSSANGPNITAEILRLLPSLALIVTSSVGVDHVDLQECRHRGVAVATARNLFSEDVADLAVGLVIDVLRKISAADRFVRRGLWASTGDYPLASKLSGKRVGIVGLGNIGREVGKRLEGFGCTIFYYSRDIKPFVSYPYYPQVAELAENSDVLVVCCALTDQTRHLIDKEVLSKLGREGVIVNVGRGAIIDEKELVRFLVEGEIRGAGLDVFENEPHVPHQLCALDNVVLSPHVAVFTQECSQALAELIIENLDAFFSNKPLISPLSE